MSKSKMRKRLSLDALAQPNRNRYSLVICFWIPATMAVVLGTIGWRNLSLLPAFLATLTFTHWIVGRSLLLRFRMQSDTRNKKGVLVLSDSEKWKTHIENEWLPRMSDDVVILNWSEKHAWPTSIAASLWKHFCGYHKNYCPAVIVVNDRIIGAPYVYRFYNAFMGAKIGDDHHLRTLELDMFRALTTHR